MRRLVLGSAVLFIAACGGGAFQESGARPDAPNARRAIPMDPATAVYVQSLIATFGEDAVDTCLAAWQDDVATPDSQARVDKPILSFRAFLSACLRESASAGGGFRASAPSLRSNADR